MLEGEGDGGAERVEAGQLKHDGGVHVLQAVHAHARGHQAVEQRLPPHQLNNARYLRRMPARAYKSRR